MLYHIKLNDDYD